MCVPSINLILQPELLISIFTLFQCDKLRQEIVQVRGLLEKKDEADPDDIRKATSTLQQASLKLFEMAYKKVRLNQL